MKKKVIRTCLSAVVILLLAGGVKNVYAQLEEPDVVTLPQPRTPFGEGYKNGWGVNLMLNNFGFGIGGEYTRMLGPYTEFTFNAGITGIRDVSEQNYQNIFTGQRIVPNKYKRAFGFPFLFGLKHRIFARKIEDNFRLFVGGAVGPAMAFIYPYLEDTDGNGYRTYQVTSNNILVPVERINDFFTGWKDGESEWGFNGELMIGANFGSSFKNRTTVEFGFFFYYFKQGLQMMEPNKPVYNQDGSVARVEPFYDAQKYFGTPQIRVTFGGMW